MIGDYTIIRGNKMPGQITLLDEIQLKVDDWCEYAGMNKTQFRRGKYLYKIERVEK